MEEKIKNIIAGYINIPVEAITGDTPIDRTSVNSSITLHRMYARLAEEGVVVENYWEIKKFGNLLQRINRNGHSVAINTGQQNNIVTVPVKSNHPVEPGVGIDIEAVAAMPQTNDFREHEFYRMNFSASEIAYCILQPDPYASFAGLFAAKEALVKANNVFRNQPFYNIEIERTADGKPVFRGFNLSVSHTQQIAVAVAIQSNASAADKKDDNENASPPASSNKNVAVFMFISLVISLVALYFALRK